MGYGYGKQKPDFIDRHPVLIGIFVGFSLIMIPSLTLLLLTR